MTEQDSRPTTVVLNAESLSSVAATSGVGAFTRHLLRALADRDDLSLIALSNRSVPLPDGVERLPIRRVSHRARVEVMEHALRMPLELRRGRPAGSVFHNPAFHAPFGVRSPWVQTLLDVIPLVFDSPDQAVLRARWKRFGPRYRRADAVVAISQHAADEGIRLLGLDPARVRVALLGVDPSFCVGDGGGEDAAPYLLVVSEYSARKGFAEAFAVIDSLADAGYPHRLLVAGRLQPWSRQALADLRATAKHPDRIEILGFVPDLIALYQGASGFLMTSRYEGFGLPALEAMACGVPVVAFANSSITEVVRHGGALVEDGDVVAMAAAIRQVLDHSALAVERREQGVAHAATFTWAKCAAIHAEVYREVAERAA